MALRRLGCGHLLLVEGPLLVLQAPLFVGVAGHGGRLSMLLQKAVLFLAVQLFQVDVDGLELGFLLEVGGAQVRWVLALREFKK